MAQQVYRQNKPHHRPELLSLSDFEIVQTYSQELRGIANDYSLAENVSQALYPIKHAAIVSAVKTLAVIIFEYIKRGQICQ